MPDSRVPWYGPVRLLSPVGCGPGLLAIGALAIFLSSGLAAEPLEIRLNREDLLSAHKASQKHSRGALSELNGALAVHFLPSFFVIPKLYPSPQSGGIYIYENCGWLDTSQSVTFMDVATGDECRLLDVSGGGRQFRVRDHVNQKSWTSHKPISQVALSPEGPLTVEVPTVGYFEAGKSGQQLFLRLREAAGPLKTVPPKFLRTVKGQDLVAEIHKGEVTILRGDLACRFLSDLWVPFALQSAGTNLAVLAKADVLDLLPEETRQKREFREWEKLKESGKLTPEMREGFVCKAIFILKLNKLSEVYQKAERRAD